MRVSGAHIPRDAARACAFGDNADARVDVIAVSSALVLCESPAVAEPSAGAAVRISLDDSRGAWSETAATIARVDRPVVYASYPKRVAESGGASLEVHGASFAGAVGDADACVFGAVRPVVGRAVSDALAECVSLGGAGRRALRLGGQPRRRPARRRRERRRRHRRRARARRRSPRAALGGRRAPGGGRGRRRETDAGGGRRRGVRLGAAAAGVRERRVRRARRDDDGAFRRRANAWACLVPATPPASASRVTPSQIAEMRSAVRRRHVRLCADGADARDAARDGDERRAPSCASSASTCPSTTPRARRAPCCAPSAASTPRLPRLCRPRSRRRSRPDAAGGGGGASSCGSSRRAARRGPRTKAPRRSRLCRRRAPRVAPAAGWDVGGITVSARAGDGAELTQASFPPFACQFGSLAPRARRRAGRDALRRAGGGAGARPVGVAPGLVGAAGGAPTLRTAARERLAAAPRWRPRSATARR